MAYNIHANENEQIKNWVQTVISSVLSLESNMSNYLDIENIEKELNNIIYQNMKGMKNLCVICGDDLGECNPRQLCGKTFCYSGNS